MFVEVSCIFLAIGEVANKWAAQNYDYELTIPKQIVVNS